MTSSKKILITGAGGYIGSVATYLFLQTGYKVAAVDNFSTGYREPLELLQKKYGKRRLTFYKSDLINISKIFDQEQNISTVVHFAANCSVNESMENPGKYFKNNVCGSVYLLEAMVLNNIANLVFSSTCAVYGNAQVLPVTEDHPTHPANPYGESKLMMEKIIMWYSKIKAIDFVLLRYFNVCGASDDGLIGDSKRPSVHLMQNVIRGALGLEKFYLTCQEVDTPDKSPIRDYINVVDLGMAHVKAVDYLLRGGKSEIINLGTGDGNSVLEIVQRIEGTTGVKFDLIKAKPRQGEYAKMVASIKKAKMVLDWKPERTIKDSVNSLMTWYKTHPHGWNR